MPDFSLNQLVEMYMQLLAPLIQKEETTEEGEKLQFWEPLTLRYERIMTMLLGDDKDKAPVKKHREALFGPDLPPMTIPDAYQEISMAREMKIELGAYRQLPIHDRAQIIAHYRLSGMMDVFRRHTEIIAENTRKAMEKANKPRR
jgi:hypothetical protein